MGISPDLRLPPVSLHRLKFSKKIQQNLNSQNKDGCIKAVRIIFSQIAIKHKLIKLEIEVEIVKKFHLLFYCLPKEGTSSLGSQFEPLNPGLPFENKATDYLFFIFRAHVNREPDLYAATRGGHIQKKIREYVDYSFPHQLARRFLSL